MKSYSWLFSRRPLDERDYRYEDDPDWDNRRRDMPADPYHGGGGGYADRYPRYPEDDPQFKGRDMYTGGDPRMRKFPAAQEDFQSLRQRYDEEY